MQMKKILVMAMAAATVAACSKNEPAPVDNGQKQQLNVLTSVGGTRAVVAQNTLPQSSVIGVHVTQQGNSGTEVYKGQNYVAEGENLQNGENVRFDNTTDAGTWVSQNESNQVKKLMIGSKEGTVYGYYPYATAVEGVGDNATIPAGTLASGNIDLSSAGDGSQNYDDAEVDYLYYKPEAPGRATVSGTTTTVVKLTMAHAMASVSFRMYVSADAPIINNGDEYYYLMGYTIRNKSGNSAIAAGADVKMNIADGTIDQSGATLATQITRTLNNGTGYKLTRVSGSNATDGDKNALVWFGHLTFPIETIAHTQKTGVADDIEVVFEIKKGSSGSPANYTVPLAVTTNVSDQTLSSDKWLAGRNYQYTVKLNAFLELGIEQVSVAEWISVTGGDMTIE